MSDLNSEEVREEAIKWVKELRTQLCKGNEYCEHCIDIGGTIGWIKHFFNIKEDEKNMQG